MGADVAREGCLSIPLPAANDRRGHPVEVEARSARLEYGG